MTHQPPTPPAHPSLPQLSADEAQQLREAALKKDGFSITIRWEKLLFGDDADLDSALALINREPAPTTVGPASLVLVLGCVGTTTHQGMYAERALALATRLVEQCAAAVLTPRLLEAIENDSGPYEKHKRYGLIKVVHQPAWASVVGAIAERFKQPVFDIKDEDGRKA